MVRNSFVVVLLFFVITGAKSQTVEWVSPPQVYEKFDEKLLTHYTENELLELKNSSPEKFEVIRYYYLESYVLEITDSTNAYQSLFYPEKFDISKYESKRKLNETVIFDFDKYGLKLILLPFSELKELTPLQIELKNELENE